MFAHYLYLDDKVTGSADYSGESLTNLEQVVGALGKLDGKSVTILMVAEGAPGPGSEAPFSGKAMSIGGGLNDEYICEAFVDPEEMDLATMLVNSFVPKSKEMVNVRRGQLGQWPRHLVVGRALVEKVVAVFVQTGELDSAQLWFRTDESYW